MIVANIDVNYPLTYLCVAFLQHLSSLYGVDYFSMRAFMILEVYVFVIRIRVVFFEFLFMVLISVVMDSVVGMIILN